MARIAVLISSGWLLSAALFKTQSLQLRLHHGEGLVDVAWLAALVMLELVTAVVGISVVAARPGWLGVMSTWIAALFGLFAVVQAWRMLAGEASCGCYGSIEIGITTSFAATSLFAIFLGWVASHFWSAAAEEQARVATSTIDADPPHARGRSLVIPGVHCSRSVLLRAVRSLVIVSGLLIGTAVPAALSRVDAMVSASPGDRVDALDAELCRRLLAARLSPVEFDRAAKLQVVVLRRDCSDCLKKLRAMSRAEEAGARFPNTWLVVLAREPQLRNGGLSRLRIPRSVAGLVAYPLNSQSERIPTPSTACFAGGDLIGCPEGVRPDP